MFSQTEENYLKAIFKLSERDGKAANTNSISAEMNTAAASVTDMLKRLAEKDLIHYEKYRGVTLSPTGLKIATNLVRRHRLWEVFLVDKLHFTWDEVHEMAEQLEHIQSDTLVERLDKFLGFPKFDPHGDPIPDANGQFTFRQQIQLSELGEGNSGVVVGVQEHSTAFLQYLQKIGLTLGVKATVVDVFEFDNSLKIKLNDSAEVLIGSKISTNVFVNKG